VRALSSSFLESVWIAHLNSCRRLFLWDTSWGITPMSIRLDVSLDSAGTSTI